MDKPVVYLVPTHLSRFKEPRAHHRARLKCIASALVRSISRGLVHWDRREKSPGEIVWDVPEGSTSR